MKTVKIAIKGVTPLLQNRFIQADIEGSSELRTGAPKEKDFKDKLYIDSATKKIYQPASHIFGALVNAGKNLKIRGAGKRTYSKIFGSSLNVIPEYIIHKNSNYIPFTITANNPNKKGNKMIVTRPMFPNWELSFEIQILDDAIPISVLKEALDYAGRYVGIGDWRPDTKGKYGQFIVTEFLEELERL